MLQFVLGRTKSGKTYEITRRICEDVKSGKKPVLIVTEQFSFESERQILKSLGDKLSKNVSVVSFTRLCDEIEREKGGCCGKSLEDCDKIILINRALKASTDELILWKRYVNSNSFATSLLNIIAEFKLNAVTADEIEQASKNLTDTAFVNKLHDIATVMRHYDALLSEHFIDPDTRLDKLYENLLESRYFDGRPVYMNSFSGFTGQQFKIIERILVSSLSLTVAMCDDINDKREFSLLYNIRNCRKKLESIAKKHNVEIAEDVFLSKSRYSNAQMKNVESVMFWGKCENSEKGGEALTVCKADSVYDEAAFAVRNIRRLVRENGAKYSDFVVIARDTEPYEEAFFAACAENKVNCFIDRRIPLITMPPAAAALCAADLALGFTSDKILKFLKSGIGVLGAEEIATIENYVFVWNIKGKDWNTQWQMSPSGLVRAQDDRDKDTAAKLERINALRQKVIEPLVEFKRNFGATPKEKASAIVTLFERCSAAENLKKTAEKYRSYNPALYDAQAQGWSVLMHTLDSICTCFGDAEVSNKEFYNALKTSLNCSSVGVTPQMADEVTFGSADRIRPSRPKYAFILGANQGVFPRSVSKGGILNLAERQKLIDNDIEISDNTLSAAVDEEYLVYSNVCCPSDMLFISYSENSGGTAVPSAFVKTLCENIDCVTVHEPDVLCERNLPETSEAALGEYCRRITNSKSESATVKAAVSGKEEYEKLAAARSFSDGENYKISKESAERLYGQNIKLSPSSIESFERCKFAHFCKYGIGAKKLQSADFDAMQRGTIAHFVLQRFIETYGKGLKDLDDGEIKDNISVFCKEYLDGVPGFESAKDPYAEYLVSTLKSALVQVVTRMRDEFLQTDFDPVKCELEIGRGGDLKPVTLTVDDLLKVTLTGKVDRIDKWNGYVRIIDYKSRKKTLTVPDVLIGKNLQMLLYLYTVCEDETYGGKPAGVFYQSLARYKPQNKNSARLNGLALNDETVRTAMERDNSGRFLPTISKKGENAGFIENEDFSLIFSYVESRLKQTAKTIASGDITAAPIGFKSDKICEYCDYRSVCHKAVEEPEPLPKYKKQEALEIMAKGGDGL